MDKQGQKLKELAKKNETADAIVHALATRERLRHFIDIRRLRYNLKREGFKIVDSDYINLWKEWEKMGLGSIVKGRIGNDDRFIMNYDMRKVAEASLKGTDLSPEDKKGVQGIVLAKAIKKRGRRKKSEIPALETKSTVTITIKTSTGHTFELSPSDIQELKQTLNQIA